jgi:hypothetical protein
MDKAAGDTDMYHQYQGLQQLQRDLLQRPVEQQQRLQPMVQQAEWRACGRLRQDQRHRTSLEGYYLQGGDQFVAFVLPFDQYCKAFE